MPTYVVRRRVDAYVDYVSEVIAGSPRQAAEIASVRDAELDWQLEGSCEFDARRFITLDASGFEIEATEIGD